ncbi:hypothetical protein [Pedobacter insulae]|uniref:Uncharacterized protein n=1 Tax=Pedobacter insulae TaxID=414048 RepID=A0A1I2TW55_9SPHI|nr:hypothetical protein [Pedobacter insulae]SFG67627.1 hypothetical protein SAMN04489864_101557 [Pedobacter insulae]
MHKRDLITAEIEKLAQVLARIMGLKVELKLAEASLLFQQTLEHSFSLPTDILTNPDLAPFEAWLETSDLPAEKLDSLSEFLYYELGISDEKNHIIAPKLNLIYEQLSNKYKIIHLVNLHRQKTLQQYL